MFAAGAVLAIVLLPSRQRLAQLRAEAAAAVSPAPGEAGAPAAREPTLTPGAGQGDE
jgi:hypothetical protein